MGLCSVFLPEGSYNITWLQANNFHPKSHFAVMSGQASRPKVVCEAGSRFAFKLESESKLCKAG